MQIIGTEIIESPEPKGGFVVEFHGDGGERVSVQMARTESGGLTRENALEKAQVLLLQVSRFGMSETTGPTDGDAMEGEPSEAVESLRQEQREKTMQRGGSALQEGLEDTYPASDPVSATYTSTVSGDQPR
jgi:hypothetical protein